MGSAPPGHWKSLCITHLATCPNQNSPTDSADEANFFASEKPFAYNMLNAFIYYNELMVDALLRGAVQQLSASITQSAPTLDDAKERWSSFLSALLVTYIPGEQPNPADSGNLFARKARQVLRLAEQQIMEPVQAVRLLSANPERPVLLVDDFVGSGNQTLAAWHRPHATGPGNSTSLSEASARGGERILHSLGRDPIWPRRSRGTLPRFEYVAGPRAR